MDPVARPDPEVRALEAGELETAARTLARSFDDDPLFVFFLPRPRQRALWLEWFQRAALGEAALVGRVWVAGEPHRGAIAVFPPHTFPAPLRATVRAIPVPPTIPTTRLLRSGLVAEWRTRRLHPSFPHLYVRVLGVDPSLKGQGLGGALLSQALSTARSLGVPAYLETANPTNLPFYRRFGFRQRDEILEHGGPPIWTLATDH